MVRVTQLPYLWRHPSGRVYFRRGKGKLVRLPALDDPGFLAAYDAARRGRPLVPTTTSIDALVTSYVASTRWEKLAPRTKADYRKVLDFLRDKIGKRDVSTITRPLAIEARDGNRHRARFANYVVQVLSVLCEHAIDVGWRKTNPVRGTKLLALGDGWEPWPAKALSAYRSVATGEARWVWEVCYWTGQRIGDVLRMRWDHIEVDDEGDEGIRVKQGKTAAEVWVPILPECRAILDEIPRRGFTILARADSRPISYRAATLAVDKARKASGTNGLVLHGLRANCASELYERGATDAQVQAITGHKSAAQARKYGRGASQKRLAKEAMSRRERTRGEP